MLRKEQFYGAVEHSTVWTALSLKPSMLLDVRRVELPSYTPQTGATHELGAPIANVWIILFTMVVAHRTGVLR